MMVRFFALALQALLFVALGQADDGSSAESGSLGSKSTFEMYNRWNRTINEDNPTLRRNEAHWHSALHSKKTNIGRQHLVAQTLAKASGVYRNKAKAKELGIEKTVIISVLNYPKGREFYKHYFRNFICFTHSYEYDLVVYVMRQKGDNYEAHMKQVRSIAKLGINALPYPEELFWLLVYGKARTISVGNKFVKYAGGTPNFEDYGALSMLVPTYEVIKSGYTVLQMDIDLVLVTDPVPHMLLGDADFVTSIENRECQENFMGTSAFSISWDIVEPNTGIMVVRPTPQGLDMFTKWLELIVDHNLVNDQHAFDKGFRRTHKMTYASNCLPVNTPGVIDAPSIRSNPNSATYCLLSDAIFQNGMTALSCTKENLLGGYSGNMILGGLPARDRQGADYQPYVPSSSAGSTRNVETGLIDPEDIDREYYMAVVHMNYAGGKSDEMSRRGLWLYQHTNFSMDGDSFDSTTQRFHPINRRYHKAKLGPGSPDEEEDLDPAVGGGTKAAHLSCKNYNITGSHYDNFTDYRKKYTEYKNWIDGMFKEMSVPGTLIKRDTGQEVFLVSNDSRTIRGFPNGDTFMKMGYEFDNVRKGPAALLRRFKVGPELENLKGHLSAMDARLIELQKVVNEKDDYDAWFMLFGRFTSPNINYNDTRFGRKIDDSYSTL